MTARSHLASWFAPLLIHNQNQSEAMQRAASAKAQGLDPKEFGSVFPGSTITTTNNLSNSGWIRGAMVGATLLTGGALGAGAALRPGSDGVKPAPPAPSGAARAWDAVYEEQQADGTWKEIRRERLPTK